MKRHQAPNSRPSIVLLLLFLTVPLHALTPQEQADAFFARGTISEQAGALLTAEMCYQLTLRLIPDHPAAQAKVKKMGMNQSDRLQHMKFDRVQFSEATLPEVMSFLNFKVVEASQGRNKMDFVLTDINGSHPVTLDFRNVTLARILDAVTEQVGLRYQREGDRVLFYKAGTSPPLPTLPIPAPPSSPSNSTAGSSPLSAPTAAELLDWTNTSGKTLKAAFGGIEDKSVVLKTPEGKTFRFPLSGLTSAGQAMATRLQKRNVPK